MFRVLGTTLLQLVVNVSLFTSSVIALDDFRHGLTKFGSLTNIAQSVIKQFNFQLKPQKSNIVV